MDILIIIFRELTTS